MKHTYSLAALTFLAAFGSQTVAQVIAPSTFTTSIQVRDEAAGTEFDDWADIPITLTDPLDNEGGSPLPFVDINTVQIANDQTSLYIRVTTHSSVISALGSGMYLAFDLDQDTGTGFDVFALGEIGSDLGYITDYPYQQATGTFNTGVEGVVDYGGAFIGLAVTYPYYETGPPVGTQIEWSIPLSLAIGPDGPGTPVFTSDTFDLMVWNDQGAGDVTEVITYTLATAPAVTGDYNGDGMVDAADYTVWRDSNGDIGADLPADGNGDMEVNGDDYTVWANNYGGPAPSSAVAVPEPAALLLVVAAVGFAFPRSMFNR
ncbi:hypothetical protein Pla108_40180 [Botrimarina colliarenosi]|uniref:PEP-CTERM protein-sorting domain-containing protein n=1 Tax=Botrimarina colliarenosi TaxID=2528001 RepID=A0A5C6A104_9BACT|nr:hypothetical protein [Botrimarina colliarenosi]TWT92878.1 hypothetical protein Pla108_40180 [Botrimarina colliarenosi]